MSGEYMLIGNGMKRRDDIMYRLFKAIIGIVWALDIFNINVTGIPFLAWLQPILVDGIGLDFWFWFLVFLVLPSTNLHVKLNKEDK